MHRFAFVLVVGLVAGCAKAPVPTPPPAPSDAAYDPNSAENTLAWLAAQRNALDAADDKGAGEKFKALTESMKGRSLAWTGTLSTVNSDGTYLPSSHTLRTDDPTPRTAEKRERHFVLACRSVAGPRPPAGSAFGRDSEPGFPSGAGDWRQDARSGRAVRLAGTIAGAEVSQRSWVTGYGVSDRVVHTEIAVTLHVPDGTVSPAP